MRMGGCQCGKVRFSSEGEALALYICHCRECQKQSASAFGMSLQVPRSGLKVVRGEPRFWSRATDSGGRLNCAYCGDCGSRLWHQSEEPSGTINIKAGALDVPVDASDAIHIWTSRKLTGVVVPAGARQFPEEPQ
jgi:hypothetical protein